VAFGVGMTLFFLLDGRSVGAALIGAVIGGVIFGAIMGPVMVSRRRRRAATGSEPRG